MPSVEAVLDVAKDAYIWVLGILTHAISCVVKRSPTKAVLVSAFPGAHGSLRRALREAGFTVEEFHPHGAVSLRQLVLLQTAGCIFVDDYYVPLAALRGAGYIVVQLWHADGAVKRFGLAANRTYTGKALRRHRRVYATFDFVCVGSERMATIMSQAFEISNERILRVGYPKMDVYFSSEFESQVDQVREKYEIGDATTTILYLPTFRESRKALRPQLDLIRDLEMRLPADTRLFFRLHPRTQAAGLSELSSARCIAADEVDAFLEVADLLVTDYSATLYERAFLAKPVAFFAYDYCDYLNQVGFFCNLEDLPGRLFTDKCELVDYILKCDYSREGVDVLGKAWNEYNRGDSAARLVRTVLDAGCAR